MPLIFQYGSNTDAARLNSPERLGGDAKNPRPVRTVGDFELAFDKWSDTNRCAASDLIKPETGGRRIWGVLYKVSKAGFKKLAEEIEGPGYGPTDIEVEEADGQVRTVKTFILREHRRRDGLWTSAKYVRHIVNGLRAHCIEDLDPAYIQHVVDEAIRTNEQAEDQDAGRRQNALIEKLRHP
jgi:hypothetical protein